MDPESEIKRCKVEFLPDDVFGWVINPGPGCEGVFEEISRKQGPHAQRYLNVRKRGLKQESAEVKDNPV